MALGSTSMPKRSLLWAWPRCCSEKAALNAVHWPIASRVWFTLSLASFSAKLGLRAMRRASASAAGWSSSRATTWFTMPSWRASSAVNQSPVNSSSLALRGPSSQGWAKYSTPFTPMPTVGSENRASSLATITSHTHRSMSPPAIVLPWAAATTGLGRLRHRQHMWR
jgi:hypothetical protein